MLGSISGHGEGTRLIASSRGRSKASQETACFAAGTSEAAVFLLDSNMDDISEREKYHFYLAGREWGLLRMAVEKRCGGICERCKSAPMSHVHHLTYIRKYHEFLEDLQGLCEPCHEFVHGRSDFDPDPHPIYTAGCSEHSPFKQEVFKSFLIQHAAICRNISETRNWKTWEYIYVDMFAGCGYLPKYRDIPGSPVIACQTISRMVPFKGMAFEINEHHAASLASRVWDTSVFVEDSTSSLPKSLELLSYGGRRCGLIYADPNELSPANTSLLDCLGEISSMRAAQYLDILLHVPATTYKRVRGTAKYRDTTRLDGALKSIGKKVIKVSRPDSQWQWTFILCTNYQSREFGRHLGWYDIAEDRGRLILDSISHTAKEKRDMVPTGWLLNPEA